MAKVLTAPLAIIKVGTQVIGKMKNIRVTETIRRGRVSGLGELTPQELPALEWNGTLNCSFYLIDIKKTGVPTAYPREYLTSPQEVIDHLTLDEDGVDIVLFKTINAGSFNATTGLIESTTETIATIKGAFIDRDGFDVTEGQISGKDQDFTYMNPILFTI
jgi:hypothetical protein